MFTPFLIEELFNATSPFGYTRRYAHRDTNRAHRRRALRAPTWHTAWHALSYQTHSRAARLTESDEAYQLTLRTPHLIGRHLEDVTLSVTDDVLTLELPALTLVERDDVTPLLEEIPTQAYAQRYRVPKSVDVEQITASLSGEALTISLPKRQPTQRVIKVTEQGR